MKVRKRMKKKKSQQQAGIEPITSGSKACALPLCYNCNYNLQKKLPEALDAAVDAFGVGHADQRCCCQTRRQNQNHFHVENYFFWLQLCFFLFKTLAADFWVDFDTRVDNVASFYTTTNTTMTTLRAAAVVATLFGVLALQPSHAHFGAVTTGRLVTHRFQDVQFLPIMYLCQAQREYQTKVN